MEVGKLVWNQFWLINKQARPSFDVFCSSVGCLKKVKVDALACLEILGEMEGWDGIALITV